MAFKPAKKIKAKLRLALIGGPGTGKTKTALCIAESLIEPGERIAVVDTEHESAAKYANKHEFDHDSLAEHHPEKYIDKIIEAEQEGYACLIIDSFSHAWMGNGGTLELVDQLANRGGNSFQAWGKASPIFRKLIEKINSSTMHIICTIRSKVEHVQERDEKTGKTVIRKLGMQPVMRDGIEFEFDMVGDIDADHRLTISKTRCEALEGTSYVKAGKEVAKALLDWLNDGVAPPAPSPYPTRLQEVYSYLVNQACEGKPDTWRQNYAAGLKESAEAMWAEICTLAGCSTDPAQMEAEEFDAALTTLDVRFTEWLAAKRGANQTNGTTQQPQEALV